MCHLNYGILVCGHNLNRLLMVQKRAVRIISYIAHTEPIFKKLNLLKLEDIFKLHQLKFYCKNTNMLLLSYFNCIPLTNMNSLHHHNTRAARNLYTYRVNHEFAKKPIRFSIIKIVNNTSALIKYNIHTHSLHGFCRYIKKHYIENYKSVCNINNCYVCQGYVARQH